VIVTGVLVPTAAVDTPNVALVDPAGTVTLAGTLATAVLLLDSDTTAPPLGAPEVSVAVPVEPVPPVTVEGLTETADSEAGAVATCGVNRHVEENGPNTPAEFAARTRQNSRCGGKLLRVTCDPDTSRFLTKGAAIVEESSTWTS
jgi:hypothetical protein